MYWIDIGMKSLFDNGRKLLYESVLNLDKIYLITTYMYYRYITWLQAWTQEINSKRYSGVYMKLFFHIHTTTFFCFLLTSSACDFESDIQSKYFPRVLHGVLCHPMPKAFIFFIFNNKYTEIPTSSLIQMNENWCWLLL
jgi:hypothetical protein